MINRDVIKLILILWMTIVVIAAQSQNVGINGTGSLPNNSAGLDVDFTNKGMLVPRVALTGTADVATITLPATSLLVYNTATAGVAPNNVTPGFYYWSGTAWTKLATSSGSSNDWTTTGNTGTTPGTNFIGTIDAKDFVFKTNNDEYMRISSDGKLGINTTIPEELFHISSGSGNMLLDKEVRIKGQQVSGATDFNIIGYGNGINSEIQIGEFTNEVNSIKIKVPLASSFGSNDGVLDIMDDFNSYPLMRFQEDHKIGINLDTPEELLHISAGNTGGHMLLDKEVRIKGQQVSGATDFNIIGYGNGINNEIQIGEFTNEVNSIKIKIPLASSFGSNDGVLDIMDDFNSYPLMRFQEDHKIGINLDTPEELFHISAGNTGGHMLLDKEVRIKGQQVSGATDFNIIGYGNGINNEIQIGEFTNEVNSIKIKVPLASSFGSNDGVLDIMDDFSSYPLMRFQEDHKIGINVDTPLELLHVNGKVKIGAYTLPEIDGASGQVLSTDGSGLVSWATTGNNGWGLTGNSGTNAGTNFIGTTDNTAFVARTNNTERMRISATGNVGIGNNNPTELLHLKSTAYAPDPSFGNRSLTIEGANNNGNSSSIVFRYTGSTTAQISSYIYGSLSNNTNYAGGLTFGVNNGSGPLDVMYFYSNRNAYFTGNNFLSRSRFQTGENNFDGQLTIYSEQGATDYTLNFNPNSAMTQNVSYNFPPDDGNASQVLTTDGTGNLSWQAFSGSGWGLTGNAGTVATTNFVGTTDAVDFVTRTNNTERMRITSAGNVGVGTATPATKLNVMGTGTSPAIPNTTSTAVFRVGVGAGEGLDFGKMGTGSYAAWMQSGFNGSAEPLSLQPLGGNVGIGTNAPARKFTVVGSESAAHGFGACMSLSNTAAGGAEWFLRSGATGTATPAGGFSIADNANYRLVINNAGNVGIGTTNPTERLTVFNGTTTGTYTTTGWAHSSDARLKTNIVTLDHSLEKVMKLNGVSYNWKNNPNEDKQIGFIAQEVEKIVPEVVVVDSDGNYAMAYQNLNALLVEAMKEQQTQIDDLKSQYDSLLKEVQQLKMSLTSSTTEAKK